MSLWLELSGIDGTQHVLCIDERIFGNNLCYSSDAATSVVSFFYCRLLLNYLFVRDYCEIDCTLLLKTGSLENTSFIFLIWTNSLQTTWVIWIDDKSNYWFTLAFDTNNMQKIVLHQSCTPFYLNIIRLMSWKKKFTFVETWRHKNFHAVTVPCAWRVCTVTVIVSVRVQLPLLLPWPWLFTSWK